MSRVSCPSTNCTVRRLLVFSSILGDDVFDVFDDVDDVSINIGGEAVMVKGIAQSVLSDVFVLRRRVLCRVLLRTGERVVVVRCFFRLSLRFPMVAFCFLFVV